MEGGLDAQRCKKRDRNWRQNTYRGCIGASRHRKERGGGIDQLGQKGRWSDVELCRDRDWLGFGVVVAPMLRHVPTAHRLAVMMMRVAGGGVVVAAGQLTDLARDRCRADQYREHEREQPV